MLLSRSTLCLLRKVVIFGLSASIHLYLVTFLVNLPNLDSRCASTSISISPCCQNSWMCRTACFINLSSGRRRICPIHLCLRALIHCSRLKVVVSADASYLWLLSVICDSIPVYALAPFSTLLVSSFNSHASVRMLHTAPEMYSLSFRSSSRSSEDRVCLSCPALAFTMAILRRTSGRGSPSGYFM